MMLCFVFMTIFRRCLSDCKVDCWLRCVTRFKDGLSVKEFVYKHDLECVLGIHAWRAGRLLLGIRLIMFTLVQNHGANNEFCFGKVGILISINSFLCVVIWDIDRHTPKLDWLLMNSLQNQPFLLRTCHCNIFFLFFFHFWQHCPIQDWSNFEKNWLNFTETILI